MSDVAGPTEPTELTEPTGPGPRRARRVAPLIVGAVAVVLAGLFALLVVADPGDNAAAGSPLLGNPAPDVRAVNADGSEFVLSHRKGSWVVLNFFTHDCVPCIREHPELIEFVDQQRALGADGAEFYSIVRDSTRDQVDDFFADRGGDWPVVYDDRYEFVNGFGVALVPETWVIDPDGIVRSRFVAEVEADPLSALIQSMREQMA
jgi:cytochrome c biogenesis protein CcmG, thiol:disulfide interchange protein DsbE